MVAAHVNQDPPGMPDTQLLLWTDNADAYLDAVGAAGLAGRVATEVLARKETPTQAQRADTEAMLAWGAPAGLLPQMPKLRWAQALTAGVEGWLALPDLPQDLTLTCARGTHRKSMAGEHPGRAVLPDQTLRGHRRGPEAQPLGAPRGDPARRPDVGNPGARRGRPGGRTDRIDDRHAGDRYPTPTRRTARCCGGASVGANGRGPGSVGFCPAAAAGDARRPRTS